MNQTQQVISPDNTDQPQNNWVRKAIIVLCIVLITGLIIYLLNAFKPEAKKRDVPETIVRVDVITAKRESYPITVNANGTIEAETRGNLVAQIRGEIVRVSDDFKAGGSFKKGDVLIQIDQRDYNADLSQSLASLSQAQANYSQEKANAKQALLDWRRLGNTTKAPPLVAREPQLAAMKAQLASAKAEQQTAQLNLSRTTLTAPYDGRIIEREAVLGQYVSVGEAVAEVFSTDGIEVRLPMSQDEFNQIGLDTFSSASASSFKVVLSSTIGTQEYTWDAQITRTNSTFDINTRQIDVFAKVDDPFGKQNGQPALTIGQFVTAKIEGRIVENVFIIPNKSVREGSYVYVVRDQKLAKQSINILWQDDKNALIEQGFNDGELVVTTSLNSTLAGARAKLTDTSEQKNALNNDTESAKKSPVDVDKKAS